MAVINLASPPPMLPRRNSRNVEAKITAADSAAPKKQKCGGENRNSRRNSLTGRDRVMDQDYPKQAKYRDGEREHIGNAPRAYITIADDAEDTNSDNQDRRLHRPLPIRG